MSDIKKQLAWHNTPKSRRHLTRHYFSIHNSSARGSFKHKLGFDSKSLKTQSCVASWMSKLCNCGMPSYILKNPHTTKSYKHFKSPKLFKPKFEIGSTASSYQNIVMLAACQQLINPRPEKKSWYYLKRNLLPRNLKENLPKGSNVKSNTAAGAANRFVTNDVMRYNYFLSDLARIQKHDLKTAVDYESNEQDQKNRPSPIHYSKSKSYLNNIQAKVSPSATLTFNARFNSPLHLHSFFLIPARLQLSRFNDIKNYLMCRNRWDRKMNWTNPLHMGAQKFQNLVTFELCDTLNNLDSINPPSALNSLPVSPTPFETNSVINHRSSMKQLSVRL